MTEEERRLMDLLVEKGETSTYREFRTIYEDFRNVSGVADRLYAGLIKAQEQESFFGNGKAKPHTEMKMKFLDEAMKKDQKKDPVEWIRMRDININFETARAHIEAAAIETDAPPLELTKRLAGPQYKY